MSRKTSYFYVVNIRRSYYYFLLWCELKCYILSLLIGDENTNVNEGTLNAEELEVLGIRNIALLVAVGYVHIACRLHAARVWTVTFFF